jgi:biotin operon repressor
MRISFSLPDPRFQEAEEPAFFPAQSRPEATPWRPGPPIVPNASLNRYNRVILIAMKTAVSLPDPLFESAEALAAELGISRSQLYATAIQAYVQVQQRTGITESLNRVYAKVDQTPDPFLEALQMVTLMRDPW